MMFLVLQLILEGLGFQLAQLLPLIPEIQNPKLMTDGFFYNRNFISITIETSLK